MFADVLEGFQQPMRIKPQSRL